MDGKYIIPEDFVGLERKDIVSLDSIFMSCARIMATRSKDPSTQVGACIVGTDNRMLTMGYNGTPKGWKDSEFPWGKNYADIAKEFEKYGSVVHAEANAIANYKGMTGDLKDATIYVTLFPCSNCAKLLVQFGVKKVIYYSDMYKDTEDNRVAKRIFEYCGIEYQQFTPDEVKEIHVPLDDPNKEVKTLKRGNSRKRGPRK